MGNHWHRFISVVSTLLSVWRRQHVTNSEWITAVSPHWHKNTSTAVKTEDFGFEAINAVGSHEMVNVTLTTREISYILGLIHRNSLKYFEYDQFFSQCSLRTTALGQNILLLPSSSSIHSTALGRSWSVQQFYSTPVYPQPSPSKPTIFILFRSSSTWSIRFNLGLPTGLVLYGVHSVIFLVVLVFSFSLHGLPMSVFVIL